MSGNYGDSDTPHIVHSFPTSDKNLKSVAKEIDSASIAGDIDGKNIDIVALHLGAFDWNTASENIPTATSVYTAYQRLLNSVCRRFDSPQIVMSGVPLRHSCDTPSEEEQDHYMRINNEIQKLNKMLHTLGREESNLHFVNNESSIYIAPLFESLYVNPLELNEKGKHIFADNLREGISSAFAQDMQELGLPEYKDVISSRSSSS